MIKMLSREHVLNEHVLNGDFHWPVRYKETNERTHYATVKTKMQPAEHGCHYKKDFITQFCAKNPFFKITIPQRLGSSSSAEKYNNQRRNEVSQSSEEAYFRIS